MLKTLEAFQRVWASPYEEARAWKETTNGKVVGWWPMYAPEELVHAAGALPVYLHGAHEAVILANQHLENFYCPPLRMTMDSFLKGHFDIVDGLLFIRVDDEVMRIAEIADMLQFKPWIHLYRRPKVLFKPIWQEVLVKGMYHLKLHLEQLVSHRINDESIQQSISIYNTNRALLRQLYNLRRQSPGVLRATEMLAVVASSMLMPKEKNNQLLKKLLSELEGKRGKSKGTKVIVTGSICDDPGEGILETIEESGFLIMDDELYIGGRYFNDDVSSNGHPIEALARYQWEKSPCPTCQQGEKRMYAPYLIEMAKRSNAQGIIHLEWNFCKCQLWDHPYIAESFTEAGIPHLRLNLAEEAFGREALRTRLEAFAETIK